MCSNSTSIKIQKGYWRWWKKRRTILESFDHGGFCDAVMMFVLAIAVVLPITSLATEYIVGDENGSTLGYDYQAWAKGKNFLVGDKLVFKYPIGAHNVFKVNGTAFKSCTVPPLREALVTGDDVIVLATPGRKWYICGVGQHCAFGQKLVITVWPLPLAPAPSPFPRW